MASATIEPPGGLSRGVSTDVRMAFLSPDSWVCCLQLASPSCTQREKCVGRCLRTVCALGCLTTSDSPVVQLSGTPWTQGIHNCQNSKGRSGGDIRNVQGGRWVLRSHSGHGDIHECYSCLLTALLMLTRLRSCKMAAVIPESPTSPRAGGTLRPLRPLRPLHTLLH